MPAKRPPKTAATRKRQDYRSASRTAPGAAAQLARLAKRCKELRIAADLSQQEAGEAADLSPKHVGAIEYGKANPTFTTLAALARAYGVSLGEMLAGV